MSIRKYEFVEFNRKFDVDVVRLIYFVIQRSRCIAKNNIAIKSIDSDLIILRNFAHIVDQRVQLYTHFEIYSQIWACWVQTKIWCWRRQTDLLRDSTSLNDQMKLFIIEISSFHLIYLFNYLFTHLFIVIILIFFISQTFFIAFIFFIHFVFCIFQFSRNIFRSSDRFSIAFNVCFSVHFAKTRIN